MRVLVDTHILLWLMVDSDRLAADVRTALADRQNEVLFSAVSVWEIAIKASLKRDDFNVRPAAIIAGAQAAGLIEREISAAVAAKVAGLPLHHRDPFDRLLVAQAIHDGALLYTADPILRRYSDLVTLVG